MKFLLIIVSIFIICTSSSISQIVQTENSILLNCDPHSMESPRWIVSTPDATKHFFLERKYKTKLLSDKKSSLLSRNDEFLNSIIDTNSFFCVDSYGNQLWRKTIYPEKATNSLNLRIRHSTNELLTVELASSEEDFFYSEGVKLNSKPMKKLLAFFDTNGKLLPYKFEVSENHYEYPRFVISNMTDDNTFAYLFEKKGDFSFNNAPIIGEDGFYIVLLTLDKKKKDFVIKKSLRIGEYYNSLKPSPIYPNHTPFTFNLKLSPKKQLMIQCSNDRPDYAKITGLSCFESIKQEPVIMMFDENLEYKNTINFQTTVHDYTFDKFGNFYVLQTFIDSSFFTVKYVFTAIDSKGKIQINDTIDNHLEFKKVHDMMHGIPQLIPFDGGCYAQFYHFIGNENHEKILRIKQYFLNGDKPRFFESKVVPLAENKPTLTFFPISSTKNSLMGISTFYLGLSTDFEKGFVTNTSKNSGYTLTTFTINDSKYVKRTGFTSIANRNFSFHLKKIGDMTKIKDSIVFYPEEIYIRPYDTLSYNITIVREDGSVLNQTKKPQKGLRSINVEYLPKGKYTIVVTSVDEKLKNTYDFVVE